MGKLAAALPGEGGRRAGRIRERLLVDSAGWGRRSQSSPHLRMVQDAVFGDRRLHIEYRRAEAQVVIKPWPQPEGGYSAEVPALQGSRIIAPTVEQAIRDIYEVIEMSVASRIQHGEPLPKELCEVRPDAEGTIWVDVAVALA